MDLFTLVHGRTVALLRRLSAEGDLPPGIDLARFSAAPPQAGSPCDIVVDAALVYARDAASVGGDPCRVARALAADLSTLSQAAAVDVAGPGFVNVTLRPGAMLDAAASMLRHGLGPGLDPSGAAAVAWAGTRRDPSPAAPSLDRARASAAAAVAASLDAAAGRQPPRGGRGAEVPTLRGSVVVVGHRGAASGSTSPDFPAVVAEIGHDAFRFAVASCRPDAALRLDLARLSDRSRANPAFWVPYAHARFHGVLRRAVAALPGLDLDPTTLGGAGLSTLSDPGEVALARLVARYRYAVSAAAEAALPRHLAAYLSDLADAVHSQWNRSKDQPQLRFVNEEQRDLTKARLGLVTASALVLKSGLGILGVRAPDEMC